MQRLIAARRKRNQTQLRRFRAVRIGGRRLTEHDVSIRSTKTERTDAGVTLCVPSPIAKLEWNLESAVTRRHRIHLREVKVRRNRSMLQTESDFDQTRDSRGRFEMTEVRLHRTHQTRSLPAKHGFERFP